MGIGVGARLFAPSSGEETRDYIAGALNRRAQETMDDVKATVADAVEAGGKAFRASRDA